MIEWNRTMPTKPLYYGIKSRGCTAPGSTRLIGFTQRGKEWFVQRDVFSHNPAAAIASLVQQGLLVGAAGHVAQLIEQAREVCEFPEEEVLLRPGWNGTLFARADGEVLKSAEVSDVNVPGVAYVRSPDRYRLEGQSSTWRKVIAPAILRDHHITMAACLSFAAVTRPLHGRTIPGFTTEVVVNQSSGVLRRVVLAITGSMVSDVLAPDPVDRVIADPARFIEASRHELLVLGDIEDYICGGSDKKRKAAARAFIFDHLTRDGDGEANARGLAVPHAVIVGNRSVPEMLDLDPIATERFRERVLTVHSPLETLNRLRGVNASSGFANETAFSRLSDSYGHALYVFQQRLVDKRSIKGLSWLQAKLDADFDEFCAHAAEAEGCAGIAESLVHSFAVIHAALRMATRLGVFPKSTCKSHAIWKVYRRFISECPRPLTAADVITSVAALPGVLVVDDLDEGTGKEQLQDAPAFIKSLGGGRRELWVLTAHKKTTFDWSVFSKLADFAVWYRGKGEKDRAGTKRVIGGWKNARVLRFRLP
jgi:hypothetical protein